MIVEQGDEEHASFEDVVEDVGHELFAKWLNPERQCHMVLYPPDVMVIMDGENTPVTVVRDDDGHWFGIQEVDFTVHGKGDQVSFHYLMTQCIGGTQ